MNSLVEKLCCRPGIRVWAAITLAALAATAIARPDRNLPRSERNTLQHIDDPRLHEFLFAPPRPATGPLFDQLDTDGDGRLAPWEIEWATESLRALDHDRDGWISNVELPLSNRHHPPSGPDWHPGPPPPPPVRRPRQARREDFSSPHPQSAAKKP